MRKVWRGFKLVVGVTVATPFGIVGMVAWAVDQFCDSVIDVLARWAKR
jgi:hypothetical protein